MSLGTANRDGGKTSESGHLRALTKAFRGEVSNGLAVSQRGAGANMSVDIAVGDAIIPRSDGTYSHPAFNDAVLNQVIATADPSNPRRDILVMYIDYNNAVSTAVSNNTNGVVKVKVVAGTPAGSPVDPTDAAIQTSVGSGNPFIKLARIRVGAGVGSVSNSVIDDLRRMAESHVQGGWLYEYLYTWAYVAANQFKIAGIDVSAIFPAGTKIMLNQGGVTLYFYVTAATFSTDTTITLDGGGTYSLSNIPIDRPAFSYEARPQGFPFSKISEPQGAFTEIGRAILTVAGNTLTVSGLPPRKYLKILWLGIPNGAIRGCLRLNNDSANNYAARLSVNGGADSADVGVARIAIEQITATIRRTEYDLYNIASQEKMLNFVTSDNASAGSAATPGRIEGSAKYVGSAVVTRVDMINDQAGTFNVGSELVVLGKD